MQVRLIFLDQRQLHLHASLIYISDLSFLRSVTRIELVAFNAEVDGGIIPISTSPSSGIEPSD
jgi:hypothetical protein